MKRVIVGLIVFASALAVGSRAAAQCLKPVPGASPALSLSVGPAEPRVDFGKLIGVTMTNISGHDVLMWKEKGGDEKQVQVDVRDENGNLPPETDLGKRENGHVDPSELDPNQLKGSGACVTVKKGESIKLQIYLPRLYDLTKSGKYTIKVQTIDPESGAIVKSNSIRITVR